MRKDALLAGVVNTLQTAGFSISERCDIRPRSFDMVARRDSILLLIKVLSNIDGLNQETADELLYLSKHLGGSPLVIGEKTRDHPLETGVVYLRYGVPAFDINTTIDYLIKNVPPLIYAAHGGLYVNIDGNILKEERVRKNLSLGALATLLGVSRRTISKYEEGEMAISVDVAVKLEDVLDKGLVVEVSLFKKISPEIQKQEVTEGASSDIYDMLKDMGFDVLPISQAPFDAVSFSPERKEENVTILTGIGGHTGNIFKKAHLMSSISEVTLSHSVMIVNGANKAKTIEKTVLVEEKELKKYKDSGDFIDLLHQRGKRIEVS